MDKVTKAEMKNVVVKQSGLRRRVIQLLSCFPPLLSPQELIKFFGIETEEEPVQPDLRDQLSRAPEPTHLQGGSSAEQKTTSSSESTVDVKRLWKPLPSSNGRTRDIIQLN